MHKNCLVFVKGRVGKYIYLFQYLQRINYLETKYLPANYFSNNIDSLLNEIINRLLKEVNILQFICPFKINIYNEVILF